MWILAGFNIIKQPGDKLNIMENPVLTHDTHEKRSGEVSADQISDGIIGGVVLWLY